MNEYPTTVTSQLQETTTQARFLIKTIVRTINNRNSQKDQENLIENGGFITVGYYCKLWHVYSTSKIDYFPHGESILTNLFSDTDPQRFQIRQFEPRGKT